MKPATYHITLDIRSDSPGQLLQMKQFDTCRRLCICLTDGGRPYVIAADCKGVFTAKKPDGTAIFNDCQVVGNTLIYDITPQTTAAAGELACELRLYGEDDKLLTTACFGILVYPQAVSDDDVAASAPEATALKKLLERVEEAERFIDDTQYAEKAWSARRIVETLCPPFSETGEAVTSQGALEGYPVGVEAFETSVMHLGKNLVGHLDFVEDTDPYRITTCKDGVYTVKYKTNVYTSRILVAPCDAHLKNRRLPPGTYAFHIEKRGGNANFTGCYAVVQKADGTQWGIPNGESRTFDEWVTVAGFWCTNKRMEKDTEITFALQIEAGDFVTPYEACRAERFQPDYYITENEYGDTWEVYGVSTDVIPYPGINWFFAEEGSAVTVTGKADPVKTIERLTNAIVGLGGKV